MDAAVAYLNETLAQIAAKASFQVVDDTDHLTSEDALSLVTLQVRYPAFTAWATLTSVATNKGNGWYEPNGLTSAAQTVGTMLFHLPGASGYDPVDFGIVIEDKIPSDVKAVDGDTDAPTNLKNQYNETGLTGDTFPSSQAQVGLIGTGSAAVSKIASSATITSGNQTGTYADTAALDGVLNSFTPAVGEVDFYYEFLLGAGNTAAEISWNGYANVQNDVVDVFAWDWIGSAWTQIGSVSGLAGTTVLPFSWNLDTRHTGTSADAGKVRVRFFSDGGDVITNVSTDRILCNYSVTAQSVGYSNGAIWVDTVNGVAGSTPFVNGTADNPVLTWADALLLAASLTMFRFQITGNSVVTLTSDSTGYYINGDGYALNLNGQIISGLYCFGGLIIGIGVGGANRPTFKSCAVTTVNLPEHTLIDSGMTNRLTFTSAGTYIIDQGSSGVAGTGTPVVDFGAAVGDVKLNMRHHSGGVEIENMDAGDAMSLEGEGQLILNDNCTGGVIAIRGHFTITDNTNGGAGGAVTLSDSARWDDTREEFAEKVMKNFKEVKKISGKWYLIIYDDGEVSGGTEIMRKELRDVTGAVVDNLGGGILAKELASTT